MDSVDSVTDGDDFLETFDLNSECSQCQSKWSHPYQPSEESNHDEREHTPDDVVFPPGSTKYRFLKPFFHQNSNLEGSPDKAWSIISDVWSEACGMILLRSWTPSSSKGLSSSESIPSNVDCF